MLFLLLLSKCRFVAVVVVSLKKKKKGGKKSPCLGIPLQNNNLKIFKKTRQPNL